MNTFQHTRREKTCIGEPAQDSPGVRANQGFIAYRENPRYKRFRLAALTATGQDAYQLARTKENEIIESAIPGICGEKAKVSRVLLARIRENLERSSDQT